MIIFDIKDLFKSSMAGNGQDNMELDRAIDCSKL